MKNIILLSLSFFLLQACATEHDAEIYAERRAYVAECNEWQKTKGDRLLEKKPGEENWALQDVMVARCLENHEYCSPPHVPEKLKNLEKMWGVNDPTPDMCNKSN
jgi:hypothetical protein